MTINEKNACVDLFELWMSNQENQGYSDNQTNVIQGQRPDMENGYIYHKEHKVTKITHTKQKKRISN